ncbi:MAG: thymidylate synthase [Candidatus Pacebacteria bacterium]|nr:thymidylate synthase [Candidatus Paceibacterota bacterium]
MFAPVSMLEVNSFPGAWTALVKECMEKGIEINFGDPKDKKIAKEIVSMVVIGPKGVREILNKKLPSQVLFKGKQLDEYIMEYTREFVEKQKGLDDEDLQKHPYTYMGRFLFPNDQVNTTVEGIKSQQDSQILSNRVQMTTWVPEIDSYLSTSPPCLQRIWFRCDLENKRLDVHFNWRSRDLFDAWTANLIGLVWMINEYIAKPLGFRVWRVIDISDSLHIYDYNWNIALAVAKKN